MARPGPGGRLMVPWSQPGVEAQGSLEEGDDQLYLLGAIFKPAPGDAASSSTRASFRSADRGLRLHSQR
jgi:hypothetical protein